MSKVFRHVHIMWVWLDSFRFGHPFRVLDCLRIDRIYIAYFVINVSVSHGCTEEIIFLVFFFFKSLFWKWNSDKRFARDNDEKFVWLIEILFFYTTVTFRFKFLWIKPSRKSCTKTNRVFTRVRWCYRGFLCVCVCVCSLRCRGNIPFNLYSW